MLNIINHFSNLLIFKRKPQDLPYIPIYVPIITILCIVVDINLAKAFFGKVDKVELTESNIILTTIFLYVGFILILKFLLHNVGKGGRLVQTISNLFTIHLIFRGFSYVVPENALLSFIFWSWSLFLNIYVVKEAFEVSPLIGFLMYCTTWILTFFFVSLLISIFMVSSL